MFKLPLFAVLLGAPILLSPAHAQIPILNPPLVNATAGAIPDVRGLEYRTVTLMQWAHPVPFAVGPLRPAFPAPAVHLWVLPATTGQKRFGIGWNGVKYELQSVGELADWRADVEAKLQPRVQGEAIYFPRAFDFSSTPVAELFLERLGAPELRRRLPSGDLLYKISDAEVIYRRNLRDAGVVFFVRRDYDQAKQQLQLLLTISPVETRSYVENPREEAARIVADIARREADLPRPKEEIAGLIWDLQDARAGQGLFRGSLNWEKDATVQRLIEAGDRAVEPLLNALENDDRLTFSLSVPRFFVGAGSLGTVRDAAERTLEILLGHRYTTINLRLSPMERHLDVARQMRADWEKVKGQTPTERVFKTLSQPGQTPERLEEAARELVRIGKPYFSHDIVGKVENGVFKPNPEPTTFFGEPLRTRQNLSVSDLLEARILELSNRALNAKPTANPLDPTLPDNINAPDAYAPNRAMRVANALALFEAKWEPKRAAPLLGIQIERAKAFAARSPRGVREDAENGVQFARREFLLARLDTPFRAAALREYGQWVQSQPFGRFREADYAPLWQLATEPAMIAATKALFAAPLRPFQAAATGKPNDSGRDSAFQLLYSPLVRIPVVKAAIARELANPTPIGQVRARGNGTAEVVVTAFNSNGPTLKMTGARLENGASQPLRVCDLVGYRLMQNRPDKGHMPRFTPLLDLSLPRAKRDARLKEIVVLLRQDRVAGHDFGFENAN